MGSDLNRLYELHNELFNEDLDISNMSLNLRDIESNANEEYNAIISELPICVHSISLDGKILFINKAGANMLGCSDESIIIGTEYLSYISVEDLPRVSNLLAKAVDGKKSYFEFKSISGEIYISAFIPIVRNNKTIKILGYTQVKN